MVDIPWPSDNPPKPTLSWLSYGAFEECPRRWYYRYELDTYPGDEVWELRQQSKLMPWDALCGRVVDDLITAALRRHRRTGNLPVGLSAHAQARMDDYIQFSQKWTDAVLTRGRWPSSPILQPLDRYFFKEVPSDEEIAYVKNKAEACLQNFEASELYQRISATPPDQYVFTRDGTPNVWPWFLDGEAPVYVSFDAALRWGSEWLLIDWKTGDAEKSLERTLEQLHWYAAYLVHSWGLAPELITLAAAYLASPGQISYHPVNVTRMDGIRRAWARRHADLVSRKGKAGKLMDHFPTTSHSHVCQGCAFRTCPEHPCRLQAPGETSA